jgi:hypothetical protein
MFRTSRANYSVVELLAWLTPWLRAVAVLVLKLPSPP